MARQTQCAGSWAALAIFTLTSDLNSHFPALWPSHLPHRTPFPRHLSFLSFTAETKSSDPTSQLWPRRSVVMSALLMGGSRGKCAELGPQCKHIKHVASITTLCQHAKRMDIINYLGMHNIYMTRLVAVIWENTITVQFHIVIQISQFKQMLCPF